MHYARREMPSALTPSALEKLKAFTAYPLAYFHPPEACSCVVLESLNSAMGHRSMTGPGVPQARVAAIWAGRP